MEGWLAVIGIGAAGLTAILSMLIPLRVSAQKSLFKQKVMTYSDFTDFVYKYGINVEAVPFTDDQYGQISTLATRCALLLDGKAGNEMMRLSAIICAASKALPQHKVESATDDFFKRHCEVEHIVSNVNSAAADILHILRNDLSNHAKFFKKSAKKLHSQRRERRAKG